MAGGAAQVAILLMRSIGRPLRGLARAADAIGRGPTIAVDARGPDEVRHAAVAFNGMQARIDRLVADRTHALAAVSHDLRTPITRLRLRAGFMADPEAPNHPICLESVPPRASLRSSRHPKGSPPVMLAAPLAALDLPLRMLIRVRDDGQTVIAFHPIGPVLHRAGVPVSLAGRLDLAQQILLQAVTP